MRNINKFDDKFKKFTKELIEKYRTTIFAGEYEIDVNFKWKENDLLANISIDAAYLNANITVFKQGYKQYKEKGKSVYAKTILHEMCHLLTEPLYDDTINLFKGKLLHKDTIEDTRERQTQRITNTIWSLMIKK